MEKTKEWFGEWFDSPYYHILYKNRDYDEARAFIDALNRYFDFQPEDHILDLACGKGRHSIYLNSKGLHVVGVDLSEQNVAAAQQHANERLEFAVHDMRQVFRPNTFDYVLNLFTSFGYFKTDAEHADAICSAAKSLKPGGTLLIDFLNPYVVVNNLRAQETKTIEGIEFRIRKHFSEEGCIVKEIFFHDQGRDFQFHERVKAIRRWDFERYFTMAGLTLETTFGDYHLNPYVAEESDRMIFVAKKLANGC